MSSNEFTKDDLTSPMQHFYQENFKNESSSEETIRQNLNCSTIYRATDLESLKMSMTWKTKIKQRLLCITRRLLTWDHQLEHGMHDWILDWGRKWHIRPFHTTRKHKYGLYIRQHFVNNVKCLKSHHVLWLCQENEFVLKW